MLHLLLHTLRELGLLLILLAAAYGYGALLLRALKLPGLGRGEHLLFALALGLGALSLIVLGLGFAGWLYDVISWLVIVFGVGLISVEIASVIRFDTAAEQAATPATAPAAPPDEPHTLRWLVRGGLGLVIGLALGYALFANGLTPPVDYDVVAYHYALPEIYRDAHAVVYVPYILHSNWPLGAEMLFLLALMLGSELLANLVTWAFALLTCAALVLFGRRWLPPHGGLLAAALFASVPMVAALAGTGMIEVPLACYGLLAFYALWQWHDTEARGWLLLSALLAGFAASTKLTGAAAAMVFAGVALALELWARRYRNAARVFVLYGAVSLLVVLPWYWKAWVLTGNPLWPFLYPLLGGRHWDALGAEYLTNYLNSTSLPPTPLSWLTGLWHITTDSAFRFGSYQLGPYLLALLPVGLLALLRTRTPALRRRLAVLVLVALAFYTIWFFLTHQTRFLMPWVPFAALLGAAGVAWLAQQLKLPLRSGLYVLLIGWLLAGAWLFDERSRDAWALRWPYLTGAIERDAYLTAIYPGYPAFVYANQTLPADARVFLAPYESRGYYLDRAYLWANPIGQRYLPLEQFDNPAALHHALQQECITHILYNDRLVLRDIAYWGQIDALLTGTLAAHGHLLYQHDQSRLYALEPPPQTGDCAPTQEAAQP